MCWLFVLVAKKPLTDFLHVKLILMWMRRRRLVERRRRFAPMRLTQILISCMVLCLQGLSSASHAADTLYEQRRAYQKAIEYVRAGRRSDFAQLANTLTAHPLHPYLTYHDLRMRLSRVKADEIVGFREQYRDIPAATLLFRQWLIRQGTNRHWSTYLEHYEPVQSAQMQCLYLRALYGTGNKDEALAGVPALWVAPVSQPDVCNPLFDVWQKTDAFNQEVIWERTAAAISANSRTLARYLQRFMEGSYNTWGQAYYNVHVRPTRVTKTSNFKPDDPRVRQVIVHGLTRLAPDDPEAAAQALEQYRQTHSFDAHQIQQMEHAITKALAEENRFPAEGSPEVSPDLVEILAFAAIENMNWREIIRWTGLLPPSERMKDRWTYWSARALTELEGQTGSHMDQLAALSVQRTYYGFLAADLIGSQTILNDVSPAADQVSLTRLRQNPAVRRMLELLAVGDDLNARRELNVLGEQLGRTDQIALAYLLQEVGQSALAIRTANGADLLDYLDLRFPMLYLNQFQRASHASGVPLPFLMAIARQESAFDPRARSSADARGLMQMLPGTARLAARRAGVATPSTAALYDPRTNISLASSQLAFLLDRYDGHMPLAAAAYNAGEHRVDRWIKDASGMPTDVWIEKIPFHETRNYVKNVVAFNQVYGHRVNSLHPVFRAHEGVIP
jgi:soluble lytic murein transglycosylase